MLNFNEFQLTLVRHGQSTTNQNPDLMGQEAETPLSDMGRLQAAYLNERFLKENQPYYKVYSSTYTRALDTAKIALKDTGHPSDMIVLVSDLREYGAGDWIGASRTEILTSQVKAQMSAFNHAFLPPKGESLHQVERRAATWLENEIIYNPEYIDAAEVQKAWKEPPINILCFTHGMTIKCLLHYVMGFDRNFTWKISIDNTSLTKLSFGKDGWKLLCINDCAHLYRG